MNGLDLFTGIGGLSIALSEYVTPVAYCEIESYCQCVLLSRMQEGKLFKAPIWDDIKTLSKADLPKIDIIYGGSPCQDISIAGAGKGLEGQRSGLFFELLRLSKEIKPKFIFLENVPAITSRGGMRVVSEFASMGYDCRWCVISAEGVGMPHERKRWFFLAHSNSESDRGLSSREAKEFPKFRSNTQHNAWNYWSKDESKVLRMDDVVSHRVDRTHALGNSVVPPQARKAFELLIGLNI